MFLHQKGLAFVDTKAGCVCGSIVSRGAQLMYTWRPYKGGWTGIVQAALAIRRTWKERHRDKNSDQMLL